MVQENSIKKFNSIIIIGPTACGKTALSIELAKRLNGEIINADSLQIYKELNIGTAKITKEEMQGIKHYMLDFVDPRQNYSVSQYKQDAEKCFNKIIEKNKLPIIVGGTGLYINSLLYNNNYGNCSANEDIRNKYDMILQQQGKEYLYDLLTKIDYVSAKKLHYNDTKRVIRALEIYECTGKTKSEWEEINKLNIDNNLINPLIIGLNYASRDKLYERINKRVDIMFENGLEQEVLNLLNNGINFNNQAMQAIGYKEFKDFIQGKINLHELKDNIKLNTRHYAKRQLTYFNKLPVDKWYNVDEINLEEILNDIETTIN